MSSVGEVRSQCVYVIKTSGGHIKVGIAIDPEDRLRTLQTGNHETLELWRAIDCEADGVLAADMEQAMHRFLAPLHVHGEWFKFDARLLAHAERLAWVQCRYPRAWEFWWRA
jgi:hypothetical protein